MIKRELEEARTCLKLGASHEHIIKKKQEEIVQTCIEEKFNKHASSSLQPQTPSEDKEEVEHGKRDQPNEVKSLPKEEPQVIEEREELEHDDEAGSSSKEEEAEPPLHALQRSSILQATTNEVPWPYLTKFTSFDNILVPSQPMEQHKEHVEVVLSILDEHHFHIMLTKNSPDGIQTLSLRTRIFFKGGRMLKTLASATVGAFNQGEIPARRRTTKGHAKV